MVRIFASALFTAALFAFSFPPFDFGLAAYVCLIPLLLATGDRSGRRDFFIGWLAGWAASTAVVWWVINTVVHYGGIPWQLAVPILMLLTLAMGLFWALFAWGRGFVLRRWPPWTDFLVSPLLWVSLEYARAHLPHLAFPWALLGYTQYLNGKILQTADLFGVWTVSFLLVAVNAAGATLLRRRPTLYAGGLPVGRAAPAVAAALLVAAALVYGGVKEGREEEGAALEVVVVQGNIAQEVKWDPAHREKTIETYERLTRLAAGEKVDLVVWPETAVPFYYHRNSRYRERIVALARETGIPLLFGSPAVEGRGPEAPHFNRAYLVGADGEDLGWYDKRLLVPFGEYVPYKRALFFVDKLVQAAGEFAPGKGEPALRIPGAGIGTLICYEVIFPDLVRRSVRQGATLLVNITNDAWFGRTAASRQHLATIPFRAVENRRPVARAANTGISGFVDSRGRILAASDLFVSGFYSASLHPSVRLTLYGRVGDILPMLCALAGAVIFLTASRRKPEKKRRYTL